MYDKTYGIFCWADSIKVAPFYLVGVTIEDSHVLAINSILSNVNKNVVNTEIYSILKRLNRYKQSYSEDTFKIHLYKLGNYELEKDNLTYAFIKGVRKLSLPYSNRLILTASNYISLPSSKLSININEYLTVSELTIGFLYSRLLRSFCSETPPKNLNKLKYLPTNTLINELVYSMLQDKSIKAYPLWLKNYININYERFIE